METDPVPLSAPFTPLTLLLWAPPSPEVIFGFLLIGLLLICSALISGSEVAFFSLSHSDLERLSEENTPATRRIMALKDRPQRLLATILISNNFVNIAIVLIADYVLDMVLSTDVLQGWGEGLAPWMSFLGDPTPAGIANGISFLITVVGVTFLLVLFGEASPKVYATANRVSLSKSMAGPLLLLMRFFKWPSSLLVNGTSLIERRLTAHNSSVARASLEDIDEAIALTVSTEEDGEQDSDILKRIVKFRDVAVKQIMRSRVDVVATDNQIRFPALLELVRESGYSRIPVYEEDIDNVQGILYVKDLLGRLNEQEDFNWQSLVRTNVLFVPEAKKVKDLLREFQTQHLHMAIVVDEYGGTSGIVTLEDVLEEIIGDIKDEFDDEPEVVMEKLDDFNYIFEGKTMLNDVCRAVGIASDVFDEVKGEADSFAGMVLEMLGEFPDEGQEINLPPYRLKVVAVTDRRIERILITLPTDEEQ